MSTRDGPTHVRILFDAWLPQARWGPLFHVFRLEQPDVGLQWVPTGPWTPAPSLLEAADVGLFVEPPPERGHSAITLDTSSMAVIVGAGDRLAQYDELSVADILDRPFPASPVDGPGWDSFWTLDEQRGHSPTLTDDHVTTTLDQLQVVASCRAIATVPAWAAGGLTHPGVIALPLSNGPQVRTRLVWRSDERNANVHALVELATAWTRDGRGGQPCSLS